MKKEDFLKIIRSKAKQPLNEQEESYFGSIGQAIEDAFAAETVERNNALGNITKLLGTFEEGQTAASVIRSLASKVDELEKKAQRSLSGSDKLRLREMMEEKKDEILRAKGTNNAWALEFKAIRAASAKMTTSTLVTAATAHNNPNYFDDTELVVIKYPANFIIDAIGGRAVPKVPQTWNWKEQADESTSTIGTAIGEGVAKPLTDKSFAWKSSTRKKYAGRIEFSAELEMDFDQLFLEVVNMFEEQVIRAWNDGVQTDLLAWAPAYDATELDNFFVAPGVAQVIAAGKIQVSDNNYNADIVILNPVDAAKAMIHQNVNGDIVFIPEAIAFSGLTPFISNKITAGTILVGTTGIVQEQHSNFIMRRGVYGDQLIDNEETIIGEVFSNLKLTTRSKVGWVKLTVDTVLESLTKNING